MRVGNTPRGIWKKVPFDELTPLERESMRRRRKELKYLRDVGRGATVGSKERARAHRRVRSFKSRGMSYRQMAGQTGLSTSTFSQVEQRYDRPGGMLREVYLRVMAMQFEPPNDDALVDYVGTMRRLRSLWYDGFPLPWLVEKAGVGNKGHFQKIVRGKTKTALRYRTVRAVRELYDGLADRTPEEFGHGTRIQRYCQTWAAKRGGVPRSCWDSDTIDDPDAIPEWTGRCGTPQGHQIHQRDGIPMCQPCREAGPLAGYPGFVPAKLAELRARSGLTLREVQEASGVHARTINGWELGHYKPRYPRLDEVLVVLNAVVEDVTEGEGA